MDMRVRCVRSLCLHNDKMIAGGSVTVTQSFISEHNALEWVTMLAGMVAFFSSAFAIDGGTTAELSAGTGHEQWNSIM